MNQDDKRTETLAPPRHVGLVLAAGASSRMGRPKALLRTPEGARLAERQWTLLREGGCRDVWLVLGSEAERIQIALPEIPVIFNAAWESGRLSSVLAGLDVVGAAVGYLLLPVDAAGIRPTTVQAILHAANQGSAMALRPSIGGRPGHLLWLSKRLRDRLLNSRLDPTTRLDEWVRPYEQTLALDDPALTTNLNTPEEWEAWVRGNGDGDGDGDGNGDGSWLMVDG